MVFLLMREGTDTKALNKNFSKCCLLLVNRQNKEVAALLK